MEEKGTGMRQGTGVHTIGLQVGMEQVCIGTLQSNQRSISMH